jgi:hypothetical protein
MVAEVRERLSVRKRATQKFDIDGAQPTYFMLEG